MKRVDLIPLQRQLTKQRRGHLRRCTVVCVVWALLVGSAGAASYLLWSPEDSGLQARLERAAKEISTAERNLADIRREFSAVRATLRATQAIADQPDWSILLALLGETMGPDIVLRGCTLDPGPQATPTAPTTPAAARGSAPAPQRQQRYHVTAQGVGVSQLAVTQFVLRVERSGLFSKVTLLDTSRESFQDREAVGFRMECILDGAAPIAATSPPRVGNDPDAVSAGDATGAIHE